MIAVFDTRGELRDECAPLRQVPALPLSLLFRDHVPGARRETAARQASNGGAGISQFLRWHFVSGHGGAAVALQRTAALPVPCIQSAVAVVGTRGLARRKRLSGRYRRHYRG